MSEEKKCFFCGNGSKVTELPEYCYSILYECDCCGKYILDQKGFEAFKEDENKFRMACVLNERRLKGLGGVTFDDETKQNDLICGCPRISERELLDQYPQKASDCFIRGLLNLSRLIKPEHPFEHIILEYEPVGKYHLFSKDNLQANQFLKELENEKLVSIDYISGIDRCDFTLSVKCWELIENLQQKAVDSKLAFVAMWFDPSMTDVYEKGIKPAIVKAGYDPIKIDLKEFNNKICDEIIAEIKRCKFLVSDFTDQRGGVYFEAGYAMGQGKTVIFTVKKNDVKNLHFDTRQYNHIVYESPEEICTKLYNRICATIV